MLATSPDDKVRDGKRAVELATKAAELSSYTVPHILSTLAAAYAETGDFENGQEVVEEGGRAGRRTSEDAASSSAKELASYEAGKPSRETATAGRKAAGARRRAITRLRRLRRCRRRRGRWISRRVRSRGI